MNFKSPKFSSHIQENHITGQEFVFKHISAHAKTFTVFGHLSKQLNRYFFFKNPFITNVVYLKVHFL